MPWALRTTPVQRTSSFISERISFRQPYYLLMSMKVRRGLSSETVPRTGYQGTKGFWVADASASKAKVSHYHRNLDYGVSMCTSRKDVVIQ